MMEALEHRVWVYRLALPFMTVIATYIHVKKSILRLAAIDPKINCWIVDGLSVNSRRVKEGSARWLALDTCYNFVSGTGRNAFVRKIDDFWMRVRNAQAVRNRLKIVKRELSLAIQAVSQTNADDCIRILSLAAGAAQGVIETAAQLKQRGIRCEVLLVDSDPAALRYALKLAGEHGVADSVTVREGNVLFFEREIGEFRPDIIEMIGLIDYLRDKILISLLKKIKRHLKTGGIFLTGHIHPNPESYFIRHAVNWDMIYRTQEQLEDLLVDGGFLGAKLYTEPHGIHSVAVVSKL